tara:strand:- start:385 stop:1305 length:921 start_codon:yes stop_codon:yes gene_type:complete
MAVTQRQYTADGNTTKYSITFEYLRESDVKVSLDGVDTTAFTLANATTVNLNATPNAGVVVRVYRSTDNEELESRFFAGSAIRASDLNKNFEQTLFSVQEVLNRFIDRTQAIFGNNINMSGFKITNLADGTDPNDAVNRSQLDATQTANDAALATSVSTAENHKDAAEGFKNDAQASANTASGHASDASDSADAAETSANAASDSADEAENFANAAAQFAGDPVFYGVTRNVSSGRTALRVVYSVASNTTNTYNPLDFKYKGTETAMLATNGLLHASGPNVGQPKFAFATATDASRTSGHVYIQLH